MPVLVRYCNKCGIRIAPLELEMGRAIKHKGGYYCAKCAGELVVVAEVVEEEEEPEARKPPPAARRPAAHVAPNRVPVRHVTKERAHHEDSPRGEYRQAKTNLLPLYFLIIGVFVTLVVVVLIVNRQQTAGTQPAAGTQQPANAHQPSGTAGNIPPPDLGRKTSAGVDPEAADRLRAEFDAIVKHAGDDPKELNTAIGELKAFLDKESLPAPLAAKARSRLNKYAAKLKGLAAEEFEKTQTKVARHLAALEFDKALKVLEDFPDIYANTDASREVDKEMQRVAFEKGAHEKYLEALKAADKALEKGELEEARGKLKEWLEEFSGTRHGKVVQEKLAAVVEKIKSERQLRRLGIQKEFRELEKLTAGLSEKEKHEEAARAWRDFADKYPDEKDLVEKALASARTSEELAAKAAAKAAVKPKEPRYRLGGVGPEDGVRGRGGAGQAYPRTRACRSQTAARKEVESACGYQAQRQAGPERIRSWRHIQS
jgi:predicted negative regulator of RcsB-dependent stress response